MLRRAIVHARWGASVPLSTRGRPRTIRHYSSKVGNASAALPLAGYRVLDLTRVLAGVSKLGVV